MLQDVDEFAERITYIEPLHTPRLSNRTILNGYTRAFYSPKCLCQIVYLDREVRHRGVRAALAGEADLYICLGGGGISANPAVIHDEIKPEDALIEGVRRVNISGFNVGDDALNFHQVFRDALLRSLSGGVVWLTACRSGARAIGAAAVFSGFQLRRIRPRQPA